MASVEVWENPDRSPLSIARGNVEGCETLLEDARAEHATLVNKRELARELAAQIDRDLEVVAEQITAAEAALSDAQQQLATIEGAE